MEKIKNVKCEQKGRKITLEFEPEFIQGDEIYTLWDFNDNNYLKDFDFNINISKIDGRKIKAKIAYGDKCYSTEHSGIHGLDGVFKSKKDAARYWFTSEENFLKGRNRYKDFVKFFKDDKEFLEEVEQAKDDMLEKEKREKIVEALDMIKKANELLKDIHINNKDDEAH